MSQFQILYKQKNICLSSKENLKVMRNYCLESRRIRRSQAFDRRREFVFEDQEPLKPVKKKVDPIANNKVRKYTTKKAPIKQSLPPFIVGKVRHKIHSPPFLHTPQVATEQKKRTPLIAIQSFAPKNYKFKTNYIAKKPLMTIKMATPSSKDQTNSPFTFKSLLKKDNVKSNKDKENLFENITLRSQRRRIIQDSPTTSKNPNEKKSDRYDSPRRNLYATEKPIFGRLNLEKELRKSCKNIRNDLINLEMKALTETKSRAENGNSSKVFNHLRNSLSNISQTLPFETNADNAKNTMTSEAIRYTNVEHLKICRDKVQMLSPNLSAINYSPVDSTPKLLNEYQITNIHTSPQSEKKGFINRASRSKEMNSDISKSPALKQKTIELKSTISSPTNQKVSSAKNDEEHSPKLPKIFRTTDSLNKRSIYESEVKQNSLKAKSQSDEKNTENICCQSKINELDLKDSVSKTLATGIPISNSNASLVDSANIQIISLNLNQSEKEDIEETEDTLLSRLSLSSPKNCENTPILIQSPQLQQRVSNKIANEQNITADMVIPDRLILENIADKTFLKQLHEKASEESSKFNLTSQLFLFSQENETNLPAFLQTEKKVSSANGNCSKESHNNKAFEKSTELHQSPVRVLCLSGRLVDVTLSPKKRTPKKKNLHNVEIVATASPRKLTPRLRRADKEVVTTPLVISLIESPERYKSSASKQFIPSSTSTFEDKSKIQTIDLLSDDEDERSTYLANILKKYSSIKTPSPKSNNRSALLSIQNLPKIHISSPKSPCLPNVSLAQEIAHSPMRTLVLRRRIIDITPSPKKKTPKIKKNTEKNDEHNV